MKVFAAAKVNLGLKVLGWRADGFHALDSVVALLGLGDEVTLEKASATTLEIVGDGVDVAALPADAEANLAVRAARLVEREAGRPLPTRIAIRKRIPLGGGLGGGSTDAAATLRGMNDLWGLGLPRARLLALGAALGSDVPLFLLDGTVRMSGRGERVERLPMPSAPPLWVVLANDGTHCPTPRVYAEWDRLHAADAGSEITTGTKDGAGVARAGLDGRRDVGLRPTPRQGETPPAPADCPGAGGPSLQASERPNFQDLTSGGGVWDNLCFFLREGRLGAVANAIGNDLQEPCLGAFPGVARTVKALRAAGCAGVTLCGSGATVFGLVGSREEGMRALAHPALAGCWRACAQTLPDGVMAAHGPLTPIVMVRIHVGQPCSV